jgi:hypothetical protein
VYFHGLGAIGNAMSVDDVHAVLAHGVPDPRHDESRNQLRVEIEHAAAHETEALFDVDDAHGLILG